MEDKSKIIFNNEIKEGDYKKALRSKEKYIRKYGDDSDRDYPVKLVENPVLTAPFGVYDIRVAEGEGEIPFDTKKGVIVGNIRMGFGHYRISMAMASAAHALGYTPYWMDLNSFKDTTCTKVIGAQNDLYSMGSRISQKSKLFNKTVWEPLNYEGFRQLSYNASDQKNAELMAPVFKNVPKELPLIGTHVWPAQAALHAGMKYVVNAIPDNWPMALHLAQGAVHTVQTYQSYMGYRILNGMAKDRILRPMDDSALKYTGHYIDHELVKNIEHDCEKRLQRKKDGAPVRFLLSIGGAGAQKELFVAIIKYLLPAVRDKRAALYVNVGDYQKVWEDLKKEIEGLSEVSTEHMNDWADTLSFAKGAIEGYVDGVHAFFHENIFEAVYCTNLLMRSCDVLVTKPSELAFYPLPKLFLRRIGGHEKWGAIHSAEYGDGTLECEDIPHTLQMIKLFLTEESLLKLMCENIVKNKAAGLYNGAYEVVRLAMSLKDQPSGTPEKSQNPIVQHLHAALSFKKDLK